MASAIEAFIERIGIPRAEMPYKSPPKRKRAVRESVSKWYKAHKAERAAYMRKYRRRLKKTRR